jgi:hypothetical protein
MFSTYHSFTNCPLKKHILTKYVLNFLCGENLASRGHGIETRTVKTRGLRDLNFEFHRWGNQNS